jgi:nucleotide-binding universal stress UspA family protein
MGAQIQKKILILTDFSPAAAKALAYAQFIFKDQPTHFHILHLYTPSIAQSRFMAVSVGMNHAEDLSLSVAKKGLEEQLALAKKGNHIPQHSFSTQASFNLLVPAVKEVLSQEHFDMVVMGSRGKTGIEANFMGSQTLRLIKGAIGVPILAVPQKVSFEFPKSIAFATDFSRFFAASELAPLVSLAKDFKATIQVVQVRDPQIIPTEAQQFNLLMLHKYLKELPFEEHRIKGVHRIARSLGTFSEAHGIHLLALLNYHHNLIEDLSKEAIAKKLLKIAVAPLFILPELGMTTQQNFPKRKSNAELFST